MFNPVVRITLLFITCLAFACGHKKDYQYAFYYWKNQAAKSNDALELNTIHKWGIDHFYIHYMDVDWSENLGIPVPRTEVLPSPVYSYTNYTYTPVIFITNRTFERISDGWCDTLAHRLAGKLNQFTATIDDWNISHLIYPQIKGYAGPDKEQKRAALKKQFKKDWELKNNEIQIDCDWTAKTKEKYFRFLQAFKQRYPNKKISATIRLYPYKYPDKMGVPPVDKGMLMCYNMENIRKSTTENSVFDLATLKQYISDKKYPLRLDVALPMFGWYAWFRGNQFKGIIYDSPPIDTEQANAFDKIEHEKFRLKMDTVIQNNYLREGDILRREYPDEAQLIKANKLLQTSVGKIERVAIYHWDYPTINNYENAIQAIFPQP